MACSFGRRLSVGFNKNYSVINKQMELVNRQRLYKGPFQHVSNEIVTQCHYEHIIKVYFVYSKLLFIEEEEEEVEEEKENEEERH